MTLSVALNTAASGLMAAQTGLRTTSDNIANVNTPGYVRKQILQEPLVRSGAGMGVAVTGIARVTDQYLQLASLTAGADASKWTVVSEYLDNAQSLFGDPSGTGFFFTRVDDVLNSFAQAADDPSSGLLRSQALGTVETFLEEADRINASLADLSKTVESRLLADVSRANALLDQIQQLNTDITKTGMAGGDPSGSENIQAKLIDELAGLINIRVQKRELGGVVIRSTEGVQLAGDRGVRLVYERTDSTPGYISVEGANGGYNAPIQVTGGEIRGLLDLRDDVLPNLADQLGEYVNRAAEQINRVHNDSVAFPAPATLTGRATGLLDMASAAAGFTGTATVAIVNNAGVVQRTVEINFSPPTMSVDGAAATGFVLGDLANELNTRLAGVGAATYTNGAFEIRATAAGSGVAIDEGTSAKNGKGFSHFFGLNDLIRTGGLSTWETGLTGASAHGFTGAITMRISEPDGRFVTDVTVTPPGGGDMNALLAALNGAAGVGPYGQFTLDAAGALSFSPHAPMNAKVSVLTDTTQRGAGGPSMSELFGIGVIQRSQRAGRWEVDPAISADPTGLGLAKLDLTVAAGQPAVRPADNSGALAMAAAGEVLGRFSAAGGAAAVTMSLSRYGAEFAGAIGRKAEAAELSTASAEAVKTEADTRRQGVEGVNLDEELVRLTTYQQAFNASARMIQAAKDLYDTLLGMVGRG